MSHHYVLPTMLENQHTSIRSPATCKAVDALANDPALFQALSVGQRCVALYQSPSTEAPTLRFTWTTDDRPLGDGWKPFHIFRSDLAMHQNAMAMKCALYVCPILLDGEYPTVEVISTKMDTSPESEEEHA